MTRKHSPETIEKIRAAMNRPETIEKIRAAKLGKQWIPPPGFESLYAALKSKLGATEAKRLVIEDAAIKARRAERAA